MTSVRKTDVVIIGAGMAGLAAACELEKANIPYVLLEARSRVGGRVFTGPQMEAVAVEYGAEFIHGRPNEIWEIIDEQLLPAYETAWNHWRLVDGAIIDAAKFTDSVEKILENLGEASTLNNDVSFAEYLQRFCTAQSDESKDIARSFVEGFNAADSSLISSYSLAVENDAADSSGGNASFRLTSGYQPIVEYFAKQLDPGKIALNRRVTQIDWGKAKGVMVHCSSTPERPEAATVFSAKQVIITLPISILQRSSKVWRAAGNCTIDDSLVIFVPVLDPHIQEAIDSFVMGDVVKVVLQFSHRFWEAKSLKHSDGTAQSLWDLGFIHCQEAAIPTWWTMVPLRVPVVVGWVAGPHISKLVSRKRDDVISAAIASFAQVTGETENVVRDYLIEAFYHDWHSDPFSLGAYSYIKAGDFAKAGVLLQPVGGKLIFAGEHTALDGYWSTVHGAIASGRRAASQVMRVR